MATIQKVELADGDTRWRWRFYSGTDPENGKPRILTGTTERKKDAEREITRLKRMRDQGGAVAPSKEPLGRYLRTWLQDVKRGSVRARTYAGYRSVLRRYILEPPDGAPEVGKIRLHRLTPQALQALYGHLQRGEGLSPRTVRSLHAVIRMGLKHAARTGAIGHNVADLVVLPKVEDREVEAMSQDEADRFLAAARKDDPQWYALFALLLSGGLRPSEALALKWEDVDLSERRLHVQRSLTRRGVKGWKLVPPKTKKGRRVVALPSFACQALREHRVRQAERRLALGEEYNDHGFVFASAKGAPHDGANVYRRPFRRVMAAAGLGEWREVRSGGRVKETVRRFSPRYRMYDLRHSCATLLLRAGLNPKDRVGTPRTREGRLHLGCVLSLRPRYAGPGRGRVRCDAQQCG